MSAATSLRLTDEGKEALDWLKTQVGGFNLNAAVSQWLEEEAKRRGKDAPVSVR